MGLKLISDKTHLTNFSGGQEMHAVYATLVNIDADVVNSVSEHACMLLAVLPTSKFPNTVFPTATEAKEMPGILQRQLFH